MEENERKEEEEEEERIQLAFGWFDRQIAVSFISLVGYFLQGVSRQIAS